jgi:hypothetical protein
MQDPRFKLRLPQKKSVCCHANEKSTLESGSGFIRADFKTCRVFIDHSLKIIMILDSIIFFKFVFIFVKH